MRLIRLYLAVVLGVASFHQANGKYAIFEIQQVPIDRVMKNLLLRLEKNTNDFEATYYLARVHSMAYSTNLVEVPVWKERKVPLFEHPSSDSGVPPSVQSFATAEHRLAAFRHLTNAIMLYERAIVLLKKSTNFYEMRWTILPSQLGLAWCLEQAGRTNDAIAMYRKTLKVAWKME